MESPEDAIFKLVRDTSVYRGTITPESALYHDLRIWGDDAYELLTDLHRRFGTSFQTLNFPVYFPCEGPFNDFFAWRARAKRPRLTVGHLIAVVERGDWFEP
jgi:hypothetical protein